MNQITFVHRPKRTQPSAQMDRFGVLFILFGLIALCLGDGSYTHDGTANNYLSAPYPAAVAAHSQQQHVQPYAKYEEPEGFSVQSGYEGYLVPTEPPFSFSDFLRTAGALTVFPPFSKLGWKLGLKFGVWGLGLLSLFIVGSLFTTAVCSFTPLCSISFIGFKGLKGLKLFGLKGVDKESVRAFMTEERIQSAAKFLHDAIDKFSALNKKDDKKN